MIEISSPKPMSRIVGQNRCADDLGDRRAAEEERVAEVAPARSTGDRPTSWSGMSGLSRPHSCADLVDLLLGQVLVAQQDALGRARHHPEQQEVEHDDREDREDRLDDLPPEIPAAHRRRRPAGWRLARRSRAGGLPALTRRSSSSGSARGRLRGGSTRNDARDDRDDRDHDADQDRRRSSRPSRRSRTRWAPGWRPPPTARRDGRRRARRPRASRWRRRRRRLGVGQLRVLRACCT